MLLVLVGFVGFGLVLVSAPGHSPMLCGNALPFGTRASHFPSVLSRSAVVLIGVIRSGLVCFTPSTLFHLAAIAFTLSVFLLPSLSGRLCSASASPTLPLKRFFPPSSFPPLTYGNPFISGSFFHHAAPPFRLPAHCIYFPLSPILMNSRIDPFIAKFVLFRT